MQCEKCEENFVGEKWQKLCKRCYASSKSVEQLKVTGRSLDTEKSIVRQVLYKCAAELLDKGTPAAKVNDFVKELEAGFYQ